MRHLILFVAEVRFAPGLAGAQDWAQWRGPSRDGSLAAAVVPKAWPASISRTWQVEVGEGYASPVVAEGRAFIHGRRDPDEVVTAIDLATGKVVWQQTYPAAFQKNQYATQMAKGPNSTPLIAGSRLFTLGVTGVLSAWSGDARRRAGYCLALIPRGPGSAVPRHQRRRCRALRHQRPRSVWGLR